MLFPHIGMTPLLLDDELDELDALDALLDDELDDELDELDEALDALLVDDVLDELLDDELDEPPVEDALDALLDDEPSKLETLLISTAPSVSNAQASAMTLNARANETMVQIVNERD